MVGFLQDRVDVELLDDHSAVIDFFPRNDFKALDQFLGFDAAVRLDIPDDDVDAVTGQAPGGFEHRVGFSHARRHAEKDLQFARFLCRASRLPLSIGAARRGRVV